MVHNAARNDGQGRVNYEIARQALRDGHQVNFIAEHVDDDLLQAGARIVTVRAPLSKPDLVNVRYFAWQANRAVRAVRSQTDVIFGNGYVMTEPHHISLCQFVHGAWLQSPVHNSRLRRGPYGWYHRLYSSCTSRWEKLAYAATKVIVAPSEATRGELLRIGVPREKVCVIHNAVDPVAFHPGAGDRTVFGVPPDACTGIFVGDIRTPRKNLDTVLRALVLVPQVHLLVVGGTRRSPYPALAAKLGISERVHFLDFRRDVADIMRACDFFVFPTRYEPFGNVVLEAMASGLAVIVSAAAGAAELLGNGTDSHVSEGLEGVIWTDAGVILKNAEDNDALAAVMRRFAADPQEVRRLGSAARRIAENHSWQRMAEQYLVLAEEAFHPATKHSRP